MTYHGSDLTFTAIHAHEMTDTQFKYKCVCKKGFHCHGNGGDPLTNRVEYRSSHCHSVRSSQSEDLEIHIDDRTVRKLSKQNSKQT